MAYPADLKNDAVPGVPGQVIVSSTDFGVLVDTNDIVRALAENSNTALSRVLKKSGSFPASGESARADLDKIIATVNKNVAESTQKKMVSAYSAGKKRGRKPYRFADEGRMRRYSDGRMKKGLESDAFIRSTGTGIFINLSVLDTYAKQWARLNFGALPRGSRDVKDERIKLFRSALSDSPSLSRIGARPGFRLPPTRKAVAVGSDKALASTPNPRSLAQSQAGPYIYLYPYKTAGLSKRKFDSRATKGIQGWRFIDQGIAHMNKQYGKELTKGLNQWIKQVDKGVAKAASQPTRQSRPAKVTATPNRPYKMERVQNRIPRGQSGGGRFAPGFSRRRRRSI
jgi:hypothetical protein